MICNKVIVWGLRNTWHTHQYIHDAFYKAYVHMGYETYWVNSVNELPTIDLSQSFIIYSGTDCPGETPPIRKDCFYFFHNSELYNTVVQKYGTSHVCKFQVPKKEYTTLKTALPFENCKEHYVDIDNNTFIFPWGTNLLPYEIDQNIKTFPSQRVLKTARHVGSLGAGWAKPYQIYAQYLKTHYNIPMESQGGYPRIIPEDKMVDFLKEALIAPALQFDWQVENEYIPCRIFKNISYGKMGITNNNTVNKLFDNKLIYDSDLESLVHKTISFYNQPKDYQDHVIKELMGFVKNNHTYVSRIQSIHTYLSKYKNVTIALSPNAEDTNLSNHYAHTPGQTIGSDNTPANPNGRQNTPQNN